MQLNTSETPRRFAQIWPSAATGKWVIREGMIGRTGRVRETDLHPNTTPVAQLAAPYLAQGYVEVSEDAYDVVVAQFPLSSAARDRWLAERVWAAVDAYLDERGLGHVDGFDRGKRFSDNRIVTNIFAFAVDGEMGAVAAMAALRAGRLDATRATIAYRTASEDEWTIRYERRAAKLPGPFSL